MSVPEIRILSNLEASDDHFLENVQTLQSIYVAPNVDLVNTSTWGVAIELGSWASADIEGAVSSTGNAIHANALDYGGTDVVNVGATGSVNSTASWGAAISSSVGDLVLTNNGQITGWRGVGVNQEASITNNGLISASGFGAIFTQDASVGASSDAGSIHLANSGQIVGSVNLGIHSFLYDSGTISGPTYLEGGATTADEVSVQITTSGQLLDSADALTKGSFVTVLTPYAALNTSGTYNIINYGLIESYGSNQSQGVTLYRGSGVLDNLGTIYGSAYGVYVGWSTGENYIFNSDLIEGDDALFSVNGSGNLTLVNQGVVAVKGFTSFLLWTGQLNNEYAVDIANSSGSTRVVNSGTIDGQVAIDATKSTLVNSGTIDGDVTFGSGAARVVNTGAIDGKITFSGDNNVFLGQGGAVSTTFGVGPGTIVGSGANSRYYAGGPGFETFDLTKDGAAVAVGGTGLTLFDYGAVFTNAMQVTGHSNDTSVDLEGDYTGAKQIFLGTGNFVGVTQIRLGAGHDYSFAVEGAVSAGPPLTILAGSMGAGQTLRVDASGNVNQLYAVEGGEETDIFTAAVAGIQRDWFFGGSNANNVLILSTAGTVQYWQMHMSGLSVIRLAAGTNDIQLADNIVGSAHNQTLTLKLKAGPDTIDDSRVTTTTNTVISNATMATGDDNFIFGAAHDIVTLGASNSNSANYDTITNFDFANDSLRVQGFAPHAIDGSVFGSLSAATFDADLATALAGHLHSSDALLFTATSGGLAGETFLIAATNGTDGYAAGDLVVKLTGSISGTLTTANV